MAESEHLTVYFDASCPLCTAEIDHYRRLDRGNCVRFVDVSGDGKPLPAGLTRREAMARFHIAEADGTVLSGAAAFVALWRRIPGWRWAARIAALPGVMGGFEFAYRLFLRARPAMVALFIKFTSRGAHSVKPG